MISTNAFATDKLTHPILRQKSAPLIEIADPLYCFYCGTPYNLSANVPCGACGFPQSSPIEFQKKFITHKRVMLGDLEAMHEQSGKVRVALFALAALMLANYILAFLDASFLVQLLLIAFTVVPFVVLAWLSPKQPFACAIVSAVIFGLIALISFFASPMGGMIGLMFKLGEIAALIFALKAGYDFDQFKNSLIQNRIDLKAQV